MQTRRRTAQNFITRVGRFFGGAVSCFVNGVISGVISGIVIAGFIFAGLSPLSGTTTSHASVKVTHNDLHDDDHEHHETQDSGSEDDSSSKGAEHHHAHHITVCCAQCAVIAPDLIIGVLSEVNPTPRFVVDVRKPGTAQLGSIFRPPIAA